MKNPYEFTVLYRKDGLLKETTARQMSLDDMDAYFALVDLEEITCVESSLIDEKKITIISMKDGHVHNVLMPYRDCADLVLQQCSKYKDFMSIQTKQ